MADQRFRIVFRGEVAAGESPDRVRERLGQRLRLSADRLERLFSGRPVVIKRGLDHTAAQKIHAAFEGAGAVCELQAEPAEPEAPATTDTASAPAAEPPSAETPAAEAPPAEPKPAAEDPGARTGAGEAPTAAAAGSEAPGDDPNRTVIPLPVPDDLGDLDIDRSESYAAPTDETPAPEIDTTGLDIADSPEPLEPPDTTTQPPQIDTSDLELAPLERPAQPR